MSRRFQLTPVESETYYYAYSAPTKPDQTSIEAEFVISMTMAKGASWQEEGEEEKGPSDVSSKSQWSSPLGKFEKMVWTVFFKKKK